MEKTKNTKNTLLGRLPAWLGTLALAGVLLGMGGCASIMVNTENTESSIKNKDGIVFAAKTLDRSVAEVCDKVLANNDERCKRQGEFNAYLFNVTSHSTIPTKPNNVVAFVPVSAGELNILDVAKLRFKDSPVAYFEMIASRGGKDENCLWITNWPGASGVFCPKYNWDFRKDMNL